jgi:hypothetical protein
MAACEWMAGKVRIRPRLVELFFIVCNLHNSICAGSSEMLIAQNQSWSLLGPREPACLSRYTQCAAQPPRYQAGCCRCLQERGPPPCSAEHYCLAMPGQRVTTTAICS